MCMAEAAVLALMCGDAGSSSLLKLSWVMSRACTFCVCSAVFALEGAPAMCCACLTRTASSLPVLAALVGQRLTFASRLEVEWLLTYLA